MLRTLFLVLLRVLLVAIAYTFIAWFGLFFVVKPEGMAAFWPSAGFMLAVMVLSDKRNWPALLVGAFVGNTAASIIFFNNSLLVSMGFGFFNCSESLLTSWVLRRVIGAPITMTRLRELIGLTVLAAILANAITATFGALVPTLAFGAPYWAVWRVWWTGAALGMLLVTPMILSWATVTREELKGFSRQRTLEASILLTASSVVTYLVFSSTVKGTSFLLPLPYVTFPFLLWAAVRFGPRGASLAALTMALIAVWHTAQGSGPFAALSESPANKVLSVQGFLAAAVLSSLMLSIVIHERQRAEEALRTANESLEVRIQDRTKELSTANEKLNVEVVVRQRAEEEVRRTVAELARSNGELEQFAYVASHDLREPLRGVGGMVALLAQGYRQQLDDRAQEYITHIVEGVGRMQMLIDDLLELSRIGTRRRTVRVVDLRDILKAVTANLSAAIQESGAVVTDEGLPALACDPTHLTQLLQNLVGNAIKFRGEAPPAVHVKAELKGNEWVFAVRDNGIGIDPKYFDRIFTIFQRLHNRRAYPGSGIGLAICKKIVALHGGRIWVDSAPGQGASFYFTCPQVEAEGAAK